ncbi:MAG TPA: GNAT family N-acetyltransferase [Rhizomicrobium sp.]|nr:GNAT family N-acetyltransferase [Rhizomicrobium sp.]
MSATPQAQIHLTPFSLDDADELFLIRGDAEAMRYWDWPCDRTSADTRLVAQRMLEDVQTGTAKIWTVRLEDRAFVGVVDLSEIANGEADLGFMIRRDFWGDGLAFGACVLALLNARAMNLHRLKARIHADNARSRKLLQRLGFAVAETRDVEIRAGVVKRCEFFALYDLGARFVRG